MSLYAQGGWAALAFEAIARESGVGKSSLYRRWSSRDELLRAALEARWLPVDTIDTGTLRGDLRELAEMIFNNRTGKLANLEYWFLIDAAHYPEVRKVTTPYMQETVLEARSIARRAIRRGESPRSLDAGLLMDLLVGAVNNHVMTTPRRLRAEMIRKAPVFLDRLVEVVLRGVGAGNSTG
jgi:AcrR family transcriptional regulator